MSVTLKETVFKIITQKPERTEFKITIKTVLNLQLHKELQALNISDFIL